ncbi:DHH family phosphoesterase [Mammaliicoccus sciuri]|uniref:DHH family phosphoesterase n=1 Tax=Mammaliicoccus sciuri TaxID=1296 RepID=UPI002B25D017|nr:DHH family phosphoesterase [Mammaliicoccus sciuri]WQL34289.1 DHH family phosphoesterase [Mammaliicoccus sciuri]WQL61228.1 DHH family phosphoesterase [Mammaliicoccus sciuri]
MEVTLKSEYTSSVNPLHFVLKNRGIDEEDIKKIIKPTEELIPNWRKLKNIEEGISLLNRHIEEGNKIAIQNDPDMDGLTSTSVIYKYITQYLKHDNVVVISPKGKFHGILLDKTLEVLSKGDLLITPDSGSSDFFEHDELHKHGIDVLVIDHHLAPVKTDTPAVIINNQLSDDFPNKQLTGSAMAYLFCLGYSEGYNLPLPTDLQDLSASGMVADRADFSKDIGAYYMMRTGLKKENIHSKLIKYLIQHNSNLEDSRDMTAKDIGFNVAPLFNSVFRMGKPEELEQVIHGMCEFDYTIFNKRLKKDEHIVAEAYRRASAVKRRQKKQEDEVMEKITERIKDKGSDQHKILIVNSTGIIEDNGLNGLVAMKLVREYKRPVLMVKVVGDKLKGSARNVSNSPIPDLSKFLTDTGKFICRGHANAFGVEFDISVAGTVQDELDNLLLDIDFNDAEYEVDFQWNGYADTDTIYELAENTDIWCNGIDEPLIHVKDYVMQKDDIKFIGKTERTIKFTIQGVDCVKFNISEDEKFKIIEAPDTIAMNIVATAGVNTYMGKNTPQLLIEDFEIGVGEAVGQALDEMDFSDLPF